MAEASAAGFQLVDELIARLRDGRLDSTPTPRSGWYDHQFHALVPFLMPEKMPEAERLLIGPRYRAELEAQFRALFALTRETHIKQLEVLAAGGYPTLIVSPRLTTCMAAPPTRDRSSSRARGTSRSAP